MTSVVLAGILNCLLLETSALFFELALNFLCQFTQTIETKLCTTSFKTMRMQFEDCFKAFSTKVETVVCPVLAGCRSLGVYFLLFLERAPLRG